MDFAKQLENLGGMMNNIFDKCNFSEEELIAKRIDAHKKIEEMLAKGPLPEPKVVVGIPVFLEKDDRTDKQQAYRNKQRKNHIERMEAQRLRRARLREEANSKPPAKTHEEKMEIQRQVREHEKKEYEKWLAKNIK